MDQFGEQLSSLEWLVLALEAIEGGDEGEGLGVGAGPEAAAGLGVPQAVERGVAPGGC